MSEDRTAMHAASHYGNALLEAVYKDALTSAWKHDRLICYKWGLYRRLLYFANLLLCSAAILKKGIKRQRGVDRGVKKTGTSCKETETSSKEGKKKSLLEK